MGLVWNHVSGYGVKPFPHFYTTLYEVRDCAVFTSEQQKGNWTVLAVDFLSRWLKQSFYKAYQPNPAKTKAKMSLESEPKPVCIKIHNKSSSYPEPLALTNLV